MSTFSLSAQFHRPRGFVGLLAGAVMYLRISNRRRARWAIELLNVGPSMRVVEIGFGPGYALRQMAAAHPDCEIAGLDHSALMVRIASWTNRRSIASRRMTLHEGTVRRVTDLAPVDRVLSINTLHAITDVREAAAAMLAALRPGGRVVIVEQPRGAGATTARAQRTAAVLAREMRAVGFTVLRTEELPLRPTAIAIIATSQVGAEEATADSHGGRMMKDGSKWRDG